MMLWSGWRWEIHQEGQDRPPQQWVKLLSSGRTSRGSLSSAWKAFALVEQGTLVTSTNTQQHWVSVWVTGDCCQSDWHVRGHHRITTLPFPSMVHRIVSRTPGTWVEQSVSKQCARQCAGECDAFERRGWSQLWEGSWPRSRALCRAWAEEGGGWMLTHSPSSWSPLCVFGRAASLGLYSPPLSTPSAFQLHCSSGSHLQNLGFVRPLHPPVSLAGDAAEQLVEILLSQPWRSPPCLSFSSPSSRSLFLAHPRWGFRYWRGAACDFVFWPACCRLPFGWSLTRVCEWLPLRCCGLTSLGALHTCVQVSASWAFLKRRCREQPRWFTLLRFIWPHLRAENTIWYREHCGVCYFITLLILWK